MIRQELMDILRCPACAKAGKGKLHLYKDCWLICEDCQRKYPVIEEIPVMLIDEGSKWISSDPETLAVPPVME